MTVDKFEEQARHNRQVADTLSRGEPVSLQWAVTCMFYAALHYVNAYLTHHSHRLPTHHVARDTSIAKHMRGVYNAYKRLKMESEHARYSLGRPTRQEFDACCRKVAEIEKFVANSLRRVH